jgi:Ca2+/Na+ antiporter
VWHRQAVRHGGKFLKHMVPAVIKPMHSLWHEVIGFFFLCFAAVFAFRTYSYYKSYMQAPPAAALNELIRVVVTAFFVLVMAAFGISSFLRARRISRS